MNQLYLNAPKVTTCIYGVYAGLLGLVHGYYEMLLWV